MPRFLPGKKFIKYFLLVLIGIILLVLILLSDDMRESDAELMSVFLESGIDLKIERIPYENTQIRYIESHKTSNLNKAVLFIHGAPGSASDFTAYLKDSLLISSGARLVGIDRLGYGYSGYGNPYPSIIDQANAIQVLIKSLNLDSIVLVSHSYGGPIASLVSDNVDKVIAHIALAPVVDPNNELTNFLLKIPSYSFFKPFFSKAIEVAASEKAIHPQELLELSKILKLDQSPTLVIHGKKDFIAPYQNANYLKEQINSSVKVILLEDESHFMPWTQHSLVVDYILSYMR